MRLLSKLVGALVCMSWLAGCSLVPDLYPPIISSTPEPTPTAMPSATPSPAPTPSPSPRTMTLEFWVPGFLNPYEPGPGGAMLIDQVTRFSDMNPDVQVRITVKKDTGPGGLYDLLSSASEVAPSVLPDILVLNQHDVVLAAQNSLIRRVDDELPDDAGYYPTALSSVQALNGLWAFPYVAQAEQMAYRQGLTITAPITFTSVISGGYSLLVPAGQTDGTASDMLLSIYLGSGGRVVDQSGQATLDRAVLENVYGFFYHMQEAGLLDPQQALDLASTAEAWAAYQEGAGDLTPVSSGQYWSETPEGTLPSWAPTEEGRPITILHTWGIAIVAADPGRREAAVALMRWLVSAQNMATLTRAAELLPTREQALSAWGLQPENMDFLSNLLKRSVVSLPPSVDTPVRRALQAGLTALLQGQVDTPEAAASYALTNLRR